MRFHYQTTVLKHPLYRWWTSGRIDETRANSDLRQHYCVQLQDKINTGRAVRIVFSGVYFLLFSSNLSFLIHAPDVLHFFKTLQQDLSLMSWSWSRDQDIKTFGLKTETKTKTFFLKTETKTKTFFQDQDQDQDLRIRSRDGLETKTCLETSHPWA